MASNNGAQYTRQQLQNYILTGNENTALVAGQKADPNAGARAIDFAIQHNPSAVYGLIKKKWGNAFPNLLPGSEYDQGTKESMSRYLLAKYNAVDTSLKGNFVASLLNATPQNPTINNWTNPIN